MSPAMEPDDLLGMSLDQISSRGARTNKSGGGGVIGGGGATWSAARQGGGAPRGREGAAAGGMRSDMSSRPIQSVVGGGTLRSALASARAPQQQYSSSGPVRRAGVARGAREAAAPYSRPTRNPESVFDRLGERKIETRRRDGIG